MAQATHILIVEDSRMFGAMVKQQIESELKLPALWVDCYQKAADLLEKDSALFAAALLDINLPDAQQGEVVDLVLSYSVPSIVFTADFTPGLQQQIWEKGVVDYVIKEGPDSIQYLLTLLRRLQSNPYTKVLVADDSRSLRGYMANLLKIQRFQVYEAEDGVQALNLLEKNPDIRLLLTDYHMPNIDGFTLTRQLRRQRPKNELAIIGLSAHSDASCSTRFLKYGANDFIPKPFQTEEFYCRVSQNIELLEKIEQIEKAANQDHLTGMYNRRYFFQKAPAMIKSAQKQAPEKGIGIAMLDIDYFKSINDTYGHDIGDRALQSIAQQLQLYLSRYNYLVSRFGGEEFCILLTRQTPEKSQKLLEALRGAIASCPIHLAQGHFSLTASIGYCWGTNTSLDKLISRADEALYQAKNQGRNQVCQWQEAMASH